MLEMTETGDSTAMIGGSFDLDEHIIRLDVLLVFVVFARWGTTPQPVEIFVRPEMYIQRDYPVGEPKATSKGTLVAPPLYEWIKDRVE